MSRVEDTLRAVVADLEGLSVAWALVGGLAVSARAEPCTTRDVDVAVAVAGDDEAERLIHSLTARGYAVAGTVEQTAVGRLATARLHRGSVALVDVLFASSGIEPEIVQSAERLEVLPNLTIPVASIGHLVALKVLARDDRARPQDSDDLKALLAKAQPPDLGAARAAVEQIAARGYAWQRDLSGRLEEAIDELSPD